LPTRAARLDEFIMDAAPDAGTLVELLCEDHVGTYLLPFLCRRTPEGYRNAWTGELITGSVVGWREPNVVSLARRWASPRVDESEPSERELQVQTCPLARRCE
jgi:hypothetical protein